jgi:uncharacterized protein (TIGR02599 family)
MIVPGPMKNRQERRAASGLVLQARAGFTLVEMIAAMAVALVLMGLILSMVTVMSKSWSHAAETVSTFEKARSAFETLTETLGQATCNSYWDYVDANGNPQTTSSLNSENFIPVGYKRNSELHFISGPAGSLKITSLTSPTTQGEAIFFQANMGRTANSTYKTLTSSLNSVGFFVQYWNDNALWPQFIQTATASTPNYRYRLMEWLQPTDSNHIYDSTVGTATYNINWINTYFAPYPPGTSSQTAALALADNIPLVVILPKLTPEDEMSLNSGNALASPGTGLCPKYFYDSRAWMSSYPGGVSGQLGGNNLSDLERNQLPPLVDVVMIAVDEKNVIQLQKKYGYSATPPMELQVANGSFTDSTKLASDLQTYENQLISYHINFRLFRSTVEIQAAKWSMPNY